jgi:hypothetical protein
VKPLVVGLDKQKAPIAETIGAYQYPLEAGNYILKIIR